MRPDESGHLASIMMTHLFLQEKKYSLDGLAMHWALCGWSGTCNLPEYAQEDIDVRMRSLEYSPHNYGRLQGIKLSKVLKPERSVYGRGVPTRSGGNSCFGN